MIETLAGIAEWTGSNMAYNLKFIPDDKLNWKPAPEASSALEVINHAAIPLLMIPAMLAGETPAEFAPATTREEAQELIRMTSQSYAAKLRAMTPQDLEGTIAMPFGGEWPRARAASLPTIDLIHHHGQIAYIQTLLGDTESHFEEMGN